VANRRAGQVRSTRNSDAAAITLRRVAWVMHHGEMELQTEHPEFTAWPRLVGTWSVEATHPLLPGEEIHGTAAFEWLPDQHFLVMRGHYEHPEIPDAVTVTGIVDGAPAMHYFDPRGKHRTFAVSLTEAGWRYWNHDPSFAQRFTGTFGDDDVITGRAERSEDDGQTWELDLGITYRREPGSR
jgi:hypothetical protein